LSGCGGKNEAAWQGSAKPEMPLLPVTGAGNRMKIKTCPPHWVKRAAGTEKEEKEI